MDFSEKDAARSKWKLTQRHRRGRGRGTAGGGRGGGRGGRGGGSAAAQDLGSNEDRYHDEEAEAAAAAAALGPVQQSHGADLAQLLSQAEAFDQGFYYRSRVNLAQEFGLPPEAAEGSYQGLSFDLRGLATCLELLPKSQLLDTDAFSEGAEDEEEGLGSSGAAWPQQSDWEQEGEEDEEEGEEQLLPDYWEDQQAPAGAAVAALGGMQQLVPAAMEAPLAAPEVSAAATAAGGRSSWPVAAAVPPPPPAAAAATEAGSGGDVDDLLSELLGEKATISNSATGSTSQPRLPQPQQAVSAGTTRRASQAPAAAAAAPQQAAVAPAGAPTAVAGRQAVGQQAQRGSAPAPAASSLATDDGDAELDMLLGMATGTAASKQHASVPRVPPASGSSSVQQPQQGQQAQSLEDWLDGL